MDVATAWLSITTWLDEHTPVTAATVRPPATEDEIRQVVAQLGHDLPEDLLAWWRLADGMPDETVEGHYPAQWAGVTAMLADLADRFTDPGPQHRNTQHRNTPAVMEDGVLIWD